MQNRVLVIDNGGNTCKSGWAQDSNPMFIPNYAVRPRRDNKVYVAEQLAEVTDMSSLHYRYPMDKGIVLNWELQSQIWTRITNVVETTPKDTCLALLETPFTLQQNLCHEIVFERVGFGALHRSMAQSYAMNGFNLTNPDIASNLPCAVIVDSGFSNTHIVPVYRNKPVREAVKRLNVGGKMLTNILKHSISSRHYNLDSETHLCNDIKHQICYVSLDYTLDMQISRLRKDNTIRREYFLPDMLTSFVGSVRDPALSVACVPHEQDTPSITLTNERFTGPEALFDPGSIGIEQSGMAYAVLAAIAACPIELQAPLLQNIICVGGNFELPNAAERLQTELRKNVPHDLDLHVRLANQPMETNWKGAASFIRNHPDFINSCCLTKAEWEDGGQSAVDRKFNI